MNLQKFFKKEFVVGLDIGASSIKMAQFIEKDDGLHLVRAEMKELSSEKDALSSLRYLIRGIDPKKTRFVAAINCPEASIKKVSTPYMPKSELREGISLEAKNYFPFSIDSSILDFEVLGDIVEKGVRKYEVLVGVCPIDVVNKYVSLLHEAGIRPYSFVPSSYALNRIAARMSSEASQIQCLIDIGALHTELIICKGSSVLLSRKIPVSGGDFTKAMTGALVSDKGRLQLTPEEADKIKCDVGMPSDSDTRMIDNRISAQQILAMLRSPAEHLVDDISRCFDYYRESPDSGKIDSITIFGGGASLTGLAKFMSDSLGIAVKLGDPLEYLKIEKDALRDRSSSAHRMELAIGATLSNTEGMNLLPAEIKEETKRFIRRGAIEAIVTAVVIVSVLLFLGIRIKIDNFDKRIAAARLELSSMSGQVKKAEAKKIAEMVLVDEPYWEDVFRELGSLVPPEVEMRELKMESSTMIMKGIVNSQDGQQILGDFILALEKGIFDRVKLVESKNLPDGAGLDFEIKCWIDYER